MKMNIFRNPEPIEVPTVTVNIFTNAVDNDYEFEVPQGEADRIINSFMHDRTLKITEDDKTYYINTRNIVSIEVE